MGKTVFMFPGQGTQSVGMLRDIYDAYPIVRQTFEEADDTLSRSITDLVFRGEQSALDLTVNTQPALLTAEYAMFRLMHQRGHRPDYVVGFSIGEWTAAAAAGVLDFSSALHIVSLRAEAMQKAVPVGEGAMAVIMGKDEEYVRELCASLDGYAAPANFNYPGQITVSGTASAIEQLKKMGENGDLVVNPLAVSIPSHCELMRPAAETLRAALASQPFRNAEYPLVMNVDAQRAQDAEVIKENLIAQLTAPVRFEQTVRYLLSDGVSTFLELGPGKTLAGFVRKTARKVGAEAVSNRTDSLADLASALALLGEKEG